MRKTLKAWLYRWLGADREDARLHETFVAVIAREGFLRGRGGVLLDIGARDGATTQQLLDAIARPPDTTMSPPSGPWHAIIVDISRNYLAWGRQQFARLYADTERSDWPVRSGSVNCVLMNQFLEHLKDPYRPLGEADRVLRVGGTLLIGVPNVGGLVNRLYLLWGRQPPAIHFPGPHVRGFTYRAMRAYLATNHNFRIERSFGACCYPLPPPLSEWVGRHWPAGASYMFFIARKVADAQPSPWLAGRTVTGETIL